MNRRRTASLGCAAALLTVLGACGPTNDSGDSDSAGSGTETTSPVEPTEAPPASTTPPADAAAAQVGTWRDDTADWTVRFAADGTFVEDYQGVTDFRSGTWQIAGDTLTLVGGDGNSSEGTRTPAGWQFRLGTLTQR